MMNSIAPYWDGNETWLVLGGAGLLVAFPLAYAIIMPALYLPIIIMLLALVFRGVAFEFRFVAKPHHRWWDWSFAWAPRLRPSARASCLAVSCKASMCSGGQFAGGSFEWLAPFPILCGFGLIAGYALLGSSWLMMKTEGEVAAEGATSRRGGAYRHALFHRRRQPLDSSRFRAHRGPLVPRRPARLSLARAFSHSRGRLHRLGRASGKSSGVQAFLSAMVLFLLCFLGLAISTFPYLVPPERHHLAGGGCSPIADFQLDRGPLVFAARSRLYSVCLLDLPRQGRRGRRLSLAYYSLLTLRCAHRSA